MNDGFDTTTGNTAPVILDKIRDDLSGNGIGALHDLGGASGQGDFTKFTVVDCMSSNSNPIFLHDADIAISFNFIDISLNSTIVNRHLITEDRNITLLGNNFSGKNRRFTLVIR